jgi:anti-anti-sigma factor
MFDVPTFDTLVLPYDALFGRRAIETCRQLAQTVPADGDLRLSLRSARRIDCGGVALLLRTYSQLSARGRRLVLVDVDPAVRQTLQRLGWRGLFESAPEVGYEQAAVNA